MKKPKYRIDNKKLKRLVEKAQKGDERALEQIVTESSRYIYFYSFMMLQNQDKAQDAVQDVLLTLLQKIDTIENPAFFLSWLKIVTANYCKNKLSREHEEYSLDESYEIADSSEQVNPAANIENSELSSLILGAVKELPPSQRECVMMFYFEQLTTREIAETLSVSENTVKSRLRYARGAIRKKLDGYDKNNLLLGVSPMSLISHILISEAEKQPCLILPDTALRHQIFLASIKSSVCGVGVPVKVAAVACSAIAAFGGVTTLAVSSMNNYNGEKPTQSVEFTSSKPSDVHRVPKPTSSKNSKTEEVFEEEYPATNESTAQSKTFNSAVKTSKKQTLKRTSRQESSEPTTESSSEATESTSNTENENLYSRVTEPAESDIASTESAGATESETAETESETTESTDSEQQTPSLNTTSVSLTAGSTFIFRVNGGTVRTVKLSNNKVAKINDTTLTALTAGFVTVKFMLQGGTVLAANAEVTGEPGLSKQSITVKKGKTATVKILNKAKSVDNVYQNTKYAKVISTKSSSKLTVKGYKKGVTTLKITVNGVTLKLKVKVK